MTEVAKFKTCKSCSQKLPISDFHRQSSSSDGHRSLCKECRKLSSNEYYIQNREAKLKYAAYLRSNPKYRQKQSEYHSEYRKRTEYPEQQKTIQNRYKKDNALKIKARYTLNNAITGGKIARPERCSVCLKNKNVEGHHFDYSKPLEVIWLCKDCHSMEHSDDRT